MSQYHDINDNIASWQYYNTEKSLAWYQLLRHSDVMIYHNFTVYQLYVCNHGSYVCTYVHIKFDELQ